MLTDMSPRFCQVPAVRSTMPLAALSVAGPLPPSKMPWLSSPPADLERAAAQDDSGRRCRW